MYALPGSLSGGRAAVCLSGLLLGGVLGIALLPLAAQAQMGHSFGYGQPMFRAQTGVPMQGYSSAPMMNRGGFASHKGLKEQGN